MRCGASFTSFLACKAKAKPSTGRADTWLRIILAIETMSRGPDGVFPRWVIATHLLMAEGASLADLATARLVSQASGSGSTLWLD